MSSNNSPTGEGSTAGATNVSINPYSDDAGIGRDGFERPGFDEIRAVRITQLEQLLGRTLTGTTSAEVQFAEALALMESLQWQVWEALYYAAYYPHAKGLNLDYTLAISGIDRLPRIEAGGEVQFMSSEQGGASRDRVIPAGTRVATDPDPETNDPAIVFRTTEPAVLSQGDTMVRRAPIRALGPLDRPEDTPGEAFGAGTNVAPETITRILDPVSGVGDPSGDTQGVTNLFGTGQAGERPVLNPDGTESGATEVYSFRTGRDRETDPEYRRRYENILSTAGAATLVAVRSAILAAGDGSVVLDARVDENTTNDDHRPDGGPAKSMSPYVRFADGRNDAGGKQAIAQAILDTRSAGMECYGPINPRAELADGEGGADPYPPPEKDDTLTDQQGDYRGGLGFDTIEDVPIYADAEVVVSPEFTASEADLVAAVLEYIGGTADARGLEIGEDVYTDRIAGTLTESFDGVRYIDGDVLAGTSANPTANPESIPIDNTQVAVANTATISLSTRVE